MRTTAAFGRHVGMALLEALLVATLVATLLAGAAAAVGAGADSAFAAKGGGKSSTTTSGYVVAVDQAGPYVFGQQVTVTHNVPVYPNNTGPWISMACYQNGVKVGTADHAGFEGGWYYGWPFTLGPSQLWTGGDADCSFTVWHQSNNRMVVDAATSIFVDG